MRRPLRVYLRGLQFFCRPARYTLDMVSYVV